MLSIDKYYEKKTANFYFCQKTAAIFWDLSLQTHTSIRNTQAYFTVLP